MKKQRYFNSRNINHKANSLMKMAEKYSHKEQHFLLKDSALLILDMQNYFTDKISHAYIPAVDAIIGNINCLISRFESGKRPIVLTQHYNNLDDGGMMLKWWKDHIKRETFGFNIDSRILSHQNKLIEKQYYDAFYKTELDNFLKENRVKQVVISGVMTHLCCDSTARSAFMRDYQVFFTVDGTATYLESFHNSSIINLAHGFVKPVMTSSLY